MKKNIEISQETSEIKSETLNYLIAAHSGHGLQNDSAVMHEYSKKLGEYLDKYLPVK